MTEQRVEGGHQNLLKEILRSQHWRKKKVNEGDIIADIQLFR